MEVGSVKFWRHVIVSIVLGLIVLFLLLFIIFFVRSNLLNGTVKKQAVEIERLSSQILETTVNDKGETVVLGEEENNSDLTDDAEPMDYQTAYPEMMVENADKTDDNTKKIVYLTFDDGPSEGNTQRILDILDKYGVKATFFVSAQFGTKEFRSEMYRQEIEAGHTVGLHTYSHDYKGIYQSPDSFFKDLNKIFTEVYEATGVKPNLTRFPGGSLNSYNEVIYQQLIAELCRRGFTYHDWLVSSEDATSSSWTASQELETVKRECKDKNKIVLLCHDTDSQDCTVKALPDMIEYLRDEGYEFRALDNTVRPFHFSYRS